MLNEWPESGGNERGARERRHYNYDERHTVSQASQTEWNGKEDAAVLYRRDRNLTPDNGLVPARDSLHCEPYVRARKAQNTPALATLLAVTDRSNFQ